MVIFLSLGRAVRTLGAAPIGMAPFATPSLLAALALLASLAACTDRSDPARPNVVVYLVDTLRADHLSVYGYARDTSPRLAEFGADAVRFDRAYSPSSWTRPAVASLLTGLTPIEHGAVTRQDELRSDVPVLGEQLRERGYHTAAFVTNPNVIPLWGFDRGFDHFVDLDSTDQSGRADQVTQRVLEHLGDSAPEPFFLYVHTLDPHYPYNPPAPFDRIWPNRIPGLPAAIQSDARLYDGEIAFNDFHFGALMDGLRARGLYENTLVVFASDHGEEFFDHGRTGHGLSLFEEVVRVPLLIKFPEAAFAGRVFDAPVSLLDVAPTVMAAAGAQPRPTQKGRDLAKLLQQGPTSDAAPFFFELDLLGPESVHSLAEAVLRGRYKYIRETRPKPRELLFDLDADHTEARNLSQTKPELTQRMAALVAERRARKSAGVHLWLVNHADDRPHVFRGALRTSGVFASCTSWGFRNSDELRVSENGSELEFRVILENYFDPTRDKQHYVIDTGRIAVTLEPTDAELTVSGLELDGEQASLFLGKEKQPTPLPATLRPDAPAVQVEQMGLLFKSSPRRSIDGLPGAYLGVVRPRSRKSVHVDPRTQERLRELGYVE